MNVTELKKIVNDGLVKYKLYKDAHSAILEIENLGQVKNDLAKQIESLEKSVETLKTAVGYEQKALELAKKEVQETLAVASESAKNIVLEAELKAAEAKAEYERRVKDLSIILSEHKNRIVLAKEELDNIKREYDDHKNKIEEIKQRFA